MATFPDLSSFKHWQAETTGDTLTLPIRGKEYTWRAGELSMWAMLKIHAIQQETARIIADMAAGRDVDREQIILNDEDDARLTLDLVGAERRDELVADGVTVAEYNRIVRTLTSWHLNGEKAALATWSREQKEQPADPPAPAASTTTAGSSTTRRKTPASRGKRSSTTGTSSKRTSTASTK